MKTKTIPKAKSTPKPKKRNIIEETRNAANKSIKDFTDTIEDGRVINNLLIRRGILIAEIAIRQNELNDIDKKLENRIKKNHLNEFFSKIVSEVNKHEPREVSQFLEAIKPLTKVFDFSKFLADQTSKEITNTIKTNPLVKPKKGR